MAAPHPCLLPLLRDTESPTECTITAEMVESAEEHHVAALLEGAIADQQLPVDADLRARLVASTIAAAAENERSLASLTVLLEIANDIGVEIGLFKGAAIGRTFYADPDRRPAMDIDVFVGPQSVGRLGELALALGGSAAEADTADAMVDAGRVFEVGVDVGGTVVDLHRDPMNMLVLPIDEDERWARTTPLELADENTVRTLDLEDTVMQSLLNLFRDSFADLLHINDVRLMIDAQPDWDEVERRSDLNGWTSLIRYATWFVSDALEQPSPLPTTIQRWKKRAIESMWPRDVLLKGSESHAKSLRRQSATGLLVSGLPAATAKAYGQRLLPPRTVIDQRSGQTDGLYLTALTRWRLAQRRENAAFREASYRDGQ